MNNAVIKNKALKLVFFFILFVFHNPGLYSNEDFFYLDYAIFKAENTKSFIELYYSFDQNLLTFVKNQSGFEANCQIKLSINSVSSGKKIVNENFNIPVKVQDTSGYNKNDRLTGQLNLMLDSGTYVMAIYSLDSNNKSLSSVDTSTFRLIAFPESDVVTSSLQLASKISKSTDLNSIFYKNTLEVVPNPARLYGNNISHLYYYIELYNLEDGNIGEEYTIQTSIINSENNELKIDVKNYQRKNNTKVETGSIDINDLPSGRYDFRFLIQDSKNVKIDIRKFFYIYNPSIISENNSYIQNDYLLSDIYKLTKDEFDDEFRKSKYLMQQKTIDDIEAISDFDTKKKYFYLFWNALDNNISTPQNEFKTEYFSRIAYSNKNFKSNTRPGWLTDRGRVYSLFGKPEEIDRHPFESTTKAYEIWHYDRIEGGVEFVFIDLTNDGETYELVHSTKRNEIRDDQWQRKLTVKR